MPELTPMERLEARVLALEMPFGKLEARVLNLETAKVDWAKYLPELKSVVWSVAWLLTGSGGTYVMTRPPVEGQAVPQVVPVKGERKAEQLNAPANQPVFKPFGEAK